MKRHTKRRIVNSLYYNHRIKDGDTWKTMWPLRKKNYRKLTHVTKLIETSLICPGIGLTSTFSTSYLSNMSPTLSSTDF